MARGGNTALSEAPTTRGFILPTEPNDRQQRAIDFLSWSASSSPALQVELEHLQERVRSEDVYDLLRVPSRMQQDKFQRIVTEQATWVRELPDQTTAVESYRGSGWRELNSALRHRRQLSGELAGDHQQLQALFRDVPPTEEPLLVSRGIELAEAEEFGFSADAVASAYAVETITDQGYLSTGANLLRLGPGEQQISLLLEVPAGSQVLALSAFNSWERDQEILLRAGSQLEVRNRMVHPEGGISIYAELIAA